MESLSSIDFSDDLKTLKPIVCSLFNCLGRNRCAIVMFFVFVCLILFFFFFPIGIKYKEQELVLHFYQILHVSYMLQTNT